ncbi:hepcidin [Leptodactylus fuscus]|uniref:hepcidin n=1 Tax=Leptodactylus fuscus TaxID=238119 RepID=UPI003F4EFE11
MKSLALCLILVLSVLVHRGLCASVMGHNEVADSADHLTSPNMEETNLEEVHHRTRRYSHLSICSICCHCCNRIGCGLCCKT